MRRFLLVPGLFALVPATGCYSYRSIRLEDVRPDLDVHVRVTPEATGHVASVMGYLTQDVVGKVVWLQGDTMLVTVATPTAPEAGTVQRLYQRLDLPVSQVIEVRQRTFSRGRTFGCIAAAVAGGTAVTVAAFSGILGGTGGDRPPPINERVLGPQLLVPLGRLPLGR